MIYKNSKWEKKRIIILKRDRYTCQYYKRYGKLIPADTVHHIYPVEFYPEYAYCDWNLISLSRKAHNMMHDRDTHELTAEGIALQKKIKSIKEKFDEKHIPPQNFAKF